MALVVDVHFILFLVVEYNHGLFIQYNHHLKEMQIYLVIVWSSHVCVNFFLFKIRSAGIFEIKCFSDMEINKSSYISHCNSSRSSSNNVRKTNDYKILRHIAIIIIIAKKRNKVMDDDDDIQ